MYYNLYIHLDLPKPLCWDPRQSQYLKEERGASFEDVFKGRILDVHIRMQEPHQKIFVIEYQGDIGWSFMWKQISIFS